VDKTAASHTQSSEAHIGNGVGRFYKKSPEGDRMSRALRYAAWFCVALITYLSLVPDNMEMRTPAPAGIEHAVAYGGTAMLMALAYTSWPAWMISGSLAIYSGLMELLQNFSPGRHPGLDGLLWRSAGALVGSFVVALGRRRMR
jgi:VanZ family protein